MSPQILVIGRARLVLFIWGVNAKFEVTEELASVNSMHGKTTGENSFKEFKKSNSVQHKVESAKMCYDL